MWCKKKPLLLTVLFLSDFIFVRLIRSEKDNLCVRSENGILNSGFQNVLKDKFALLAAIFICSIDR